MCDTELVKAVNAFFCIVAESAGVSIFNDSNIGTTGPCDSIACAQGRYLFRVLIFFSLLERRIATVLIADEVTELIDFRIHVQPYSR